MIGNAGGVIATLSFLGALFARQGPPLPRSAFWILALYLLGLMGTWIVLATESRWKLRMWRAVAEIGEVNEKIMKQTARGIFVGTALAGLSFVAGTVWALIYLYGLTDGAPTTPVSPS